MKTGCLWSLGIVVGLGVLGFIYLTLNPPLGMPDTGYLSQTVTRDVALTAAQPAAAFRVNVRPSPGIYRPGGRIFEPLMVRASIASEDGAAGPELRVYPLDGVPIGLLEASEDGQSVMWQMSCQGTDAGPPCPREVLVVVAAPPAAAEDVRLEIFAEQRFPQYTPTPFLVSIDVQVESQELPQMTQMLATEASSSVRLSPGSPVAQHTLVAPPADSGRGGGMLLRASIERLGDGLPAGLRAPAPVNVAVVDNIGRVVAQVSPRPGSPGAVSLPPLTGNHRLVAWWDDRADQEYELSWAIERASLGSGSPPVVEAGGPSVPSFIHEVPTDGSVAAPQPEPVQLYGSADLDMPLPDRLPRSQAVLELSILAEPELETDEPIVVWLVSSAAYVSYPAYEAERLPVVLQPGETTHLVISAYPGCATSACSAWALWHRNPDERATEQSTPIQVQISWQGRIRIWPLGEAAPAGPS